MKRLITAATMSAVLAISMGAGIAGADSAPGPEGTAATGCSTVASASLAISIAVTISGRCVTDVINGQY